MNVYHRNKQKWFWFVSKKRSLEKREFEYFLLEFHFMNFIQMIKFNLERFLSPNFQLHFPKGTINFGVFQVLDKFMQNFLIYIKETRSAYHVSVLVCVCWDVCVFTRLLRFIILYNQMGTAFFCYREKAYIGTSACLETWQIPVN